MRFVFCYIGTAEFRDQYARAREVYILANIAGDCRMKGDRDDAEKSWGCVSVVVAFLAAGVLYLTLHGMF